MQPKHSLYVLALVSSTLAFPASATVTMLDYWRMGENDPGAAAGDEFATTMDIVGGQTLTNTSIVFFGYPLYSSAVSASAASADGSQLCGFYLAGQSAKGNVISVPATTNFGIECWVEPADTSSGKVIAYNGSTGGSGWGLYQSSTNYQGLFGGHAFFASGLATTGVWTHLALVRNNGVTTLYTNGIQAGDTYGGTPTAPAGSFLIGADNAGGENFSGSIDEVRVFTFANGQFTTNDLLLNLSPPQATTLPASGITNSTATLNGAVTCAGLPTTAWFEGGLSPYPNSVLTSALTPATNISAGAYAPAGVANNLSGLSPGLNYYGWLMASNVLGVARGQTVVFGSPLIALVGAATLSNECHTAFNDPGEVVADEPLAIAAGGDHNLVLRNDHTVFAWGNNLSGQTNVPAGLTNVVAIAAGNANCLALKNDGTVVAWGDNSFGQTTIPAGLTNVMAIAAGYEDSLALKSNGTVAVWGDDTFGETNIPPGLSNVVAIAAGYIDCLAVKRDGTVAVWGDGTDGETNIPSGLSNVVAVAAGQAACLALQSGGTVVAWGAGFSGATNVPPGLSNVVAIGMSAYGDLALRNDGTIVTWGSQDRPPVSSNFVAIADGGYQSLAIESNGTVVQWGLEGFNANGIPAAVSALNYTVSGSVNTNDPGTYALTYTAVNSPGGTGTATRTVVVQDTTPPVITLNGSNPDIFTNTSRSYVDAGATAYDACNGPVPAQLISDNVNPNFPGIYHVTYTATDNSGNTATNSRIVAVTLPPAVPGDQIGNGIVTGPDLTAVYAHYITNSPWLYLTNVAGLGGTNVTFGLSNSPAENFTVQMSTDLVNWTNLGAASPLYQFTDTNAPGQPERFYRLTYP